MNTLRTICLAVTVGLLAPSLNGQVVEKQAPEVRFHTSAGSKLSVRGGAGLGQWQAETRILSGTVDADARFLTGTRSSPPIKKAELFVPVRSLKSVGQSWEPYNEQINAVVYKQLRAEGFPRISFRLSELNAQDEDSPKKSPRRYEAQGDLAIAGVTNRVEFPVEITMVPRGLLRISGQAKVRMSDFKLRERTLDCFADPDTVYLEFDWLLAQEKKR